MLGVNEYYQLLYKPPVASSEIQNISLSPKEQKVLKIFHCIRKIINKVIPPNSFIRNIIYQIVKKLYIGIKTLLHPFIAHSEK